MEKKTLLAASLAGMFALSLATTGCSKEAAPVEPETATVQAATTEVQQVEVSTANAEADKTKESCNGKDGCNGKAKEAGKTAPAKAPVEKH